jgi:hypothetical protein
MHSNMVKQKTPQKTTKMNPQGVHRHCYLMYNESIPKAVQVSTMVDKSESVGEASQSQKRQIKFINFWSKPTGVAKKIYNPRKAATKARPVLINAETREVKPADQSAALQRNSQSHQTPENGKPLLIFHEYRPKVTQQTPVQGRITKEKLTIEHYKKSLQKVSIRNLCD